MQSASLPGHGLTCPAVLGVSLYLLRAPLLILAEQEKQLREAILAHLDFHTDASGPTMSQPRECRAAPSASGLMLQAEDIDDLI